MKIKAILQRLISGTVLVAVFTLSAQGCFQPKEPLSAQTQVINAVCEKQIVVLGELPSHGEALGFQAKAQITRQLIEQCGFTALFFEAPIYDFLGFEQAIAENRANPEQLDRAIGGFWITRELAPWRQWLYTIATNNQLIIGGLDDQVSASSHYAREKLPALVAETVPLQSKNQCHLAVERNLYWRYDAAHPFDTMEKDRLEQCASLAADALTGNATQTKDSIAQIMVNNLASLYHRQQDPRSAISRDQVMFQNFLWQRERLPQNSKFIVWTASVHAARRPWNERYKPLGTWLAERWDNRLAVIGFSTFGGFSSMAGRPARRIPDAPADSLEAIATESTSDWVYLDASALENLGNLPSRVLGRPISAVWSAYFDGILVIREEVAPTFETR